MSLLSCVMAWGTEVVVNNFAELQTALSASGTADVVKLGTDIAYPTNGGSDLLNIERSLTLDGQGHKISGYAVRGAHPGQGTNNQYNKVTLVINHQAAQSGLTVSLKNLTVQQPANAKYTVAVFVYDGVETLDLEDCTIGFGYKSNHIGIAAYGTTAEALNLNLTNSTIDGTENGYAIVPLKKINATITGSTVKGYSAMTFKYPLALTPGNRWTIGFGTANIGARGSVINATNSHFLAPNTKTGSTSGYGVFVFEEDGVTINLNACEVDASTTNPDPYYQRAFILSAYTPDETDADNRRVEPLNITIDGASSVKGAIIESQYYVPRNYAGAPASPDYTPQANDTKISLEISGGTFTTDPNSVKIYYNVTERDENGAPAETSPAYTVDIIGGGVVKDENGNNIYVYSEYDYDRTITNSYGTICVDKDGKFYGGTLYTIDQIAGSQITLVETGNNDLVGGKAYVFVANGSAIHAVYNENAAAKSLVTDEALVGAYAQTAIVADPNHCIIKDNKYYHVDRTGIYVGEHRAYINLTANVVPSNAPAGRRRIVLHEAVENTATALDNVEAGAEAQKVVIDGQVFIIRGEHMYNAAGQVVK